MREERTFSFTVLRYVHDVVAGEFLNVGVVMYAPTDGILKMKTRESIKRLRQAFPEIDLQAFRTTMKGIQRGISLLARDAGRGPFTVGNLDARKHALKVLPDEDSSFQWSPVGGGLTSDPQGTFDWLFNRFVSQHDAVAVHRRSDRDIWRPVQKKLAERGVNVPFEEKVVAGTKDSIKFKSAWKNGSWHAYEAVSLDLAEENGIKNKARRWLGHLSAVAVGNSDDLQLHFLVGRPMHESLLPAYETGKAILSGSPYACEVVDENHTDALVNSIEQEYRASKA